MLRRSLCLSKSGSAHCKGLFKVPTLFLGKVMTLSLCAIPMAYSASCNPPKTYYKNVSCTSDSRYYLATKDFGEPVALLDSKGKKVADLLNYQRVDASKIAEGFMPVQRNSRIGYVDMQGREVVPTRYDILGHQQGWARAVSEGRIIVSSNGEYGIISTNNQIILPFSAQVSSIDNYHNGNARVIKNGASSVVDKQGKAIANTKDNQQSNTTSAAASRQPVANQGVVNPSSNSKNSNRELAALSNSASTAVPFTTLRPSQQDGKWGFVDDKNTIMITYAFDDVRPFSEGLAGVRIDNKWGFVNLGGELVIPFAFEESTLTAIDNYKGVGAFVFKDEKAWTGTLPDGTKRCINKKGDAVSCE